MGHAKLHKGNPEWVTPGDWISIQLREYDCRTLYPVFTLRNFAVSISMVEMT